MGKSLPTPPRLQQLARVITSNNRPRRQSQLRPVFKTRPITSPERTGLRPDSPEQLRLNKKNLKMEAENSEQRRLPLSEVVADCVKRWFQDTLKEAKAGETAMQVLVGQMYCSGYGIPKDAQKGRAWINRASKSRSSAWKVGDKHPGYNASDSDSDNSKELAK
ncbi:uncharacterized protein LOC111368525 [Olea europaea subsp. europaea]|uniref:Uncharacterized protein LOC111368525 n=1 Tax=Olea europaea subsp. europaea TaxID=158383 RepID=A0A8S0T0J1_OLEEU|nr:uncharacterized protein LOC111368525 [Olea europaea subsp. europaea]